MRSQRLPAAFDVQCESVRQLLKGFNGEATKESPRDAGETSRAYVDTHYFLLIIFGDDYASAQDLARSIKN